MSHQTFSSLKDEKQRSPLWYNGTMEDSDPEDPPSHFDLLAAASTPLRVCSGKNALFSSPTKRLDNLRLSPRKPLSLWQIERGDSRGIEIFHDESRLVACESDPGLNSGQGTGINNSPNSMGNNHPNSMDYNHPNSMRDNDSKPSHDDVNISHNLDNVTHASINIHNGESSIHNEESNIHNDEAYADTYDDLPDDSLSPAELADQTTIEESSSEDEASCPPFSLRPLPMFLRKRKHSDSPATRTPQTSARHPLSQSSFTCDMSGIKSIKSSNTSYNILKLSFSASDSTPCPPQSRKRLKFKQACNEQTPSQPSRVGNPILDLSASKKLAAKSVSLLTKLNNASSSDESDEPIESTRTGSSMQSSSKIETFSTPISQSTPANSRANSPSAFDETPDGEVNGYKFIRPVTQPNYQTPMNRYPVAPTPTSQQLLNSYNSSDYNIASRYKIVGNVPVSAAGLMDESNEDVHIGDKRMVDPYALMPASSPVPGQNLGSAALLEEYSASTDKLPILKHFQQELDSDEMNGLINDGHSVWSFYKLILLARLNDIQMMAFLKRERLRWHPDKWVNKLENSCFDESNIDNLSKVINLFIEDINNGFRDML